MLLRPHCYGAAAPTPIDHTPTHQEMYVQLGICTGIVNMTYRCHALCCFQELLIDAQAPLLYRTAQVSPCC